MDLAGTIVTADALHTQHDTATWLASRGAQYLFTIKANHPTLLATLAALPWAQVPSRSRSHGRIATPAP